MRFIPAVCSWSRVDLYHENEHWMQEYEDGTAVAPFRRMGITHRTGVNFRFCPDPELFPHREYDLDGFARWFRSLDFNGHRARVELLEKSTGKMTVLMDG